MADYTQFLIKSDIKIEGFDMNTELLKNENVVMVYQLTF